MLFMCKFKNEFIENCLFVIKKYVILIVVFRINENNNVFRFVFVV